MKFSALIPYIPDNGRRDYIWDHLQERYQRLMPLLEICTGSHNLGGYCRAKAINNAYQKASGDVFIIVDSDVYFPDQLLDQIASLINAYPWIVPFEKGIRLTRDASDRLLENGLPDWISLPPNEIDHEVTSVGAFMNVVPRTCFEAVGGFDERFVDYGGEDEAFALALDTICGRHGRMGDIIYHLWHQPMQLTPEYYRVNFPLYRRYQEACGDVTKMWSIIHEHQTL
jgi:predicted glycosyltransferase involved in capsule biosynthesis